MSNTSKAIMAIIVIIIIVAGVWYGIAKKTGEEVSKVKGPIKIGFSTALSGDAAAWGLPIKKGAEIALDKVNQEGGVNGRKLELIFEDDKCDGKEGVTVANKLINVDKVPAVIGTVCSAATLAMAPIAEQNKVLLLSSGASAPALRDAGDYIFTIYPLDNYEASIAAGFAYEKLNKRSAAILYGNNDYGKGAKEVIEQEFQNKGGKISISESYLLGSKDFRAQLTKIKNSGADVLLIWGQPNEMVPILSQIKELGIQVPIVTTSAIIETDDLKKAGLQLAEGVIYTIFETVTNDNARYLNNEYQKRYNEDGGWLSAIGYDVVLLAAEAIKNNGADGTQMKDYLYTVKNFPGASGNMSFDEYGTVIKNFVFKTVKNGQFAPYGE